MNSVTPISSTRFRHWLTATAAITLIAGAAHAQDATSDDTDLLRGPSVTDTHVPGARDSFAGRPMQGAADARPDERPVTMLGFVHAVRGLDAPGVDPSLNLNDGQRAVIEVMLREHQGQVEAWRAEHKDELKAFHGDRRKGDRSRANRAAGQPPRDDQQERAGRALDRRVGKGRRADRLDGAAPEQRQLDETAKAQLKALMATRPSAEPLQAQIWAILTPEQQAFVESSIERQRTEAAERHAMLRERKEEARENKQSRRAQRGERRGAKHEGRDLPEGMTPEQFHDLMLERIEQLPPDQQEHAMERLNRAMEKLEQRQLREEQKQQRRERRQQQRQEQNAPEQL